jgi:hypothetical protein
MGICVCRLSLCLDFAIIQILTSMRSFKQLVIIQLGLSVFVNQLWYSDAYAVHSGYVPELQFCL